MRMRLVLSLNDNTHINQGLKRRLHRPGHIVPRFAPLAASGSSWTLLKQSQIANNYEKSYYSRFKCSWIACSSVRVLQFNMNNRFVFQTQKTEHGNQGAIFGIQHFVRCIRWNIEPFSIGVVSRLNYSSALTVIAVNTLHDRHRLIRSHNSEGQFEIFGRRGEYTNHCSVAETSRNDISPSCFLVAVLLSDSSGQNQRLPVSSYRQQKVPTGNDQNIPEKNRQEYDGKEPVKTSGIRHKNRRNRAGFSRFRQLD